MDTKSKVSQPREYEDFEPKFEWIRDTRENTLALNVSQFKKEDITVQIDNTGNLNIRGERSLGNNKWSRFSKNFRLPVNCKFDEIKAQFGEGSLYIIMPKINETIEQDEPASLGEFPAPKKPPVDAKIGGIREEAGSKIAQGNDGKKSLQEYLTPKKPPVDAKTGEIREEVGSKIAPETDGRKPTVGVPAKGDGKSSGSLGGGKETLGKEEKKEKDRAAAGDKGSVDARKTTDRVIEKERVKKKWDIGAGNSPGNQMGEASRFNPGLNVVVAVLVLVVGFYASYWSNSR